MVRVRRVEVRWRAVHYLDPRTEKGARHFRISSAPPFVSPVLRLGRCAVFGAQEGREAVTSFLRPRWRGKQRTRYQTYR